MTTAITANAVLRSMASRQRMASLQAIDDLPFHERALVEEALKSVPGKRKVDIGKLIAVVRQQAYERQAQPIDQAEQAKLAFKYFASILTPDQRRLLIGKKLRAASWDEAIELCRRTLAENGVAYRGAARGRADSARPTLPYLNSKSAISTRLPSGPDDDEPTDDEWLSDEAPRPRSLKRWTPPNAKQSNAKPAAARPDRSRLLGCQPLGPDSDRPFGCPDTVSDYQQWSRPTMPSWLLPDDDDEDDDECH